MGDLALLCLALGRQVGWQTKLNVPNVRGLVGIKSPPECESVTPRVGKQSPPERLVAVVANCHTSILSCPVELGGQSFRSICSCRNVLNGQFAQLRLTFGRTKISRTFFYFVRKVLPTNCYAFFSIVCLTDSLVSQ